MAAALLPRNYAKSSSEPTATAPHRIYVIDDDVSILEMMKLQLETDGFDVCVYSSPVCFLDDLPSLEPGVVISDQRMPSVEGLGIQAALQQRSPRLPIILMSGVPSTRVSVQAMKGGAITVLDKPYKMSELIAAIREALEYLDRVQREPDTLPLPLPNGGRYLDRLSVREREVVDRVYSGATNKAAAIDLDISIKTVEKHRGKAMKKLQVNSLAELIRLMERELN